MEQHFNTPSEVIDTNMKAGEGKAHLPLGKMILLGIMAGAFIALGGATSSTAAHAIDNVGLARFVAGIIFPVGLMIIVFVGGELFTGNCLIVMDVVGKKVTWFECIRNLIVVYFSNLIGALIMSHSDDNGLVLPPHLAPIQVVIIPIYRSTEQLAQISEKVNGIVAKLKALGISVKFDDADNKKPGWKFAEYELKGVPVRLAMGGRDLENNTIEVMRRDTLEKETVTCDNIETYVQNLLEEIQKNIFQKALDHRTEKTITVDTYEEFKEKIEEGYFIMAHWDGTPETEEQVKNETKATIRCIPLEGDKTPGKCMVTGRPSAQRVLFARAY